MKNKECYLVKISSGEYDYNIVNHTGTVFLSLFSAENKKKEIEEYYASETPFPFDFCDVATFKELIFEDKLTEEDLDKYDAWMDECYKKEEFNSCWIETLKLEQ